MSPVDELTALVRKHAQGEGQIASALPGLWLYRFDRPHAPFRKRSPAMFLSVALQGQKRMQIAGVEMLYDRHNYLVVRGETDYQGAPIKASPREPYLALGVLLPPELVLSTLLEFSDSSAAQGHATSVFPAFQAPLDAPLVDALIRLVRTLDDPLDRRVLSPLAMREIVFRLLRTDAAAVLRSGLGQRSERSRIQEAMAYIAAHAHRKLTVERIAKQVAMSPSHFAHRFREIASVSPMRYQKHVRMERAREMLLTENLRTSEAAARVGYLSTAQFTRDFKRHYGLAPGAYAKTFETKPTALVEPAPNARPRVRTFAESSKKNAGPALGRIHAAG